jgi:hypothetical protein
MAVRKMNVSWLSVVIKIFFALATVWFTIGDDRNTQFTSEAFQSKPISGEFADDTDLTLDAEDVS